MTSNQFNSGVTENADLWLTATHEGSPRDFFDAEVVIPASVSREFLGAALVWLTKNKVEFAVFYEKTRIVIAYHGDAEEFMPSRWSDKRWHIGQEGPAFDPSDT